jgi:hypothetical protein
MSCVAVEAFRSAASLLQPNFIVRPKLRKKEIYSSLICT